MSLAPFGCNPTDHGSSLDDIGGFSLGSLAYSPDGGIYVAIRAQGAVPEGGVCAIKGDWDADPITTTTNTAAAGIESLCVVQEALADNDYGWGLVFGNGNILVAASCAANTALHATTTAGRVDDAASVGHIGGIQLTTARSASVGVAPGSVQWPRAQVTA